MTKSKRKCEQCGGAYSSRIRIRFCTELCSSRFYEAEKAARRARKAAAHEIVLRRREAGNARRRARLRARMNALAEARNRRRAEVTRAACLVSAVCPSPAYPALMAVHVREVIGLSDDVALDLVLGRHP